MRLEHLRREGAGRAVAAGGDDLQLALELRPLGQVVEIALAGSPARRRSGRRRRRSKSPPSTISFSAAISSGPKVSGRCDAHLDAGPAVLVVRGGDHRDARRRRARTARNRPSATARGRCRGPRAPAAIRPGDQRQLDRQRIAAEIVADDDVRPDAEPLDQRAESHAERLHADQVEVGLAFRSRDARTTSARHIRESPVGLISALVSKAKLFGRASETILNDNGYGSPVWYFRASAKPAQGTGITLYRQHRSSFKPNSGANAAIAKCFTERLSFGACRIERRRL